MEDVGPIQLFRKSDILWWLNDFPLGAPAHNDVDLMVTTDLRLPPRLKARILDPRLTRELYKNYNEIRGTSGPWGTMYPVKILNPASFTEALIRLYCRDYHSPADGDAVQLGYDEYWKKLLLPMGEVREHKDLVIKKVMRGFFKEAWESFNMPAQPYGWECFHEDLRDKLKKANELPAFPGVFRLYQ